MTWFSVRNISQSQVPAPREELWAHITSPETLAALTPMIRSIEVVEERWRWTLHGVEALGIRVEASFTERMEFAGRRRIEFHHDPPAGERERAGVLGRYEFTEIDTEVTDLCVDLTLSVDLPLPRLAAPAVEQVIASTMRATGRRFATNLYDHLGLDPATAIINELPIP